MNRSIRALARETPLNMKIALYREFIRRAEQLTKEIPATAHAVYRKALDAGNTAHALKIGRFVSDLERHGPEILKGGEA